MTLVRLAPELQEHLLGRKVRAVLTDRDRLAPVAGLTDTGRPAPDGVMGVISRRLVLDASRGRSGFRRSMTTPLAMV